MKTVVPIGLFAKIDGPLSLLIVPGAILLRTYRKFGSRKFPKTTKRLNEIGVFPIRSHYYEPIFDPDALNVLGGVRRSLPGLQFNVTSQLELLSSLDFAKELKELNLDQKSLNIKDFYVRNRSFEGGDADFLYSFMRKFQPTQVVEIGSGNSTKLIQLALDKNQEVGNQSLVQTHVCVEPYEMPWLEEFPGIKLVRSTVENLNFDPASFLNSGDLLFIDSSHMIRTGGDVLHIFQNIVPRLKSGVFVHVHDIFSPFDYPADWLSRDIRFWNEQYLVEVLLQNTDRYRIVASLNLLKNDHFESLSRISPYLRVGDQPGSLYFQIV